MSPDIVPFIEPGRNHDRNKVLQLVTFTLDREEYGVEVLSVREIIRMPELTKMPNTPGYIEGVINLRGAVVPVVSLRKRFNMDSCEKDHNSRILVMEQKGGILTGFMVDSVAEVIRIQSDAIQPSPNVVHQDGVQDCIVGILHYNQRLMIILDLDRLFDDGEHESLMEVA